MITLWWWLLSQRGYWRLGREVWRRVSVEPRGVMVRCMRAHAGTLSPAEVDRILAGVGVVEETP